jgi:uncharacterized protein YukE
MPAVGAELEHLTILKNVFDRQSGNVTELTNAIRGQLNNTVWTGPASERFRTSWQAEFEPMLHKLGEALVDSGAEVGRRQQAIAAATG